MVPVLFYCCMSEHTDWPGVWMILSMRLLEGSWTWSQKPGAKVLVLMLTNCVTLDEAVASASVFSPAKCDVNVPWESNELSSPEKMCRCKCSPLKYVCFNPLSHLSQSPSGPCYWRGLLKEQGHSRRGRGPVGSLGWPWVGLAGAELGKAREYSMIGAENVSTYH